MISNNNKNHKIDINDHNNIHKSNINSGDGTNIGTMSDGMTVMLICPSIIGSGRGTGYGARSSEIDGNQPSSIKSRIES